MKRIGVLYLLLMLSVIGVASAQPTGILSAAADPICQLHNNAPDDAPVYKTPNINAEVIGGLKQDDAYESDGFIWLGKEVWFVVTAYEGSTGEPGFVLQSDVTVTPNCPPFSWPGIIAPTPEELRNAPLLAYVSDRSGDYEMYLWDGEQSVNINLSTETQINDPVWNQYGGLAWFAYPLDGGSGDIYIWNGQQTINLDQLLGEDLAPSGLAAWSVDGRLAWAGGPSQEKEIYVWDGQHIVNISQNPARDVQPAWSVDGRLAWVSDDNGRSEIYVWDSEQVMNISQNPNGFAIGPHWSVDGRLLTWGGSVNGNLEVLVWDGEQIINVSDDKEWDAWSVWSPDGRLAWVSTRDEYGTVYVWDGESTFRVSEVGVSASNLAWSGDGRLAWQSGDGQSYDVMIWDGEQTINFTQSPDDENHYSPEWNGNGWLAWIVNTDNNWNIYVWDGEQVMNISQHTGINRYPAWQP